VHALFQTLCDLQLSKANEYTLLQQGVRDDPSIKVLRCSNSGVIFLSDIHSSTAQALLNSPGLEYWQKWWNRDSFLSDSKGTVVVEDDNRRVKQFASLLEKRDWVDIGSGLGGVLDIGSKITSRCAAVEPQQGPRQAILQRGHDAYRSVDELADLDFDVATLFHVFEHLQDPIGFLRALRKKLKPGATLIVEVPHARDALIEKFACDAFLKFTFRSDHLILHTRQSLKRFLESAGFNRVSVQGYQRYGLSNHLFWLSKSQAGGQNHWPAFNATQLQSEYSKALESEDLTDTLIAVAQCD
jgi:SAM-dependent methyltransferase